jgi:hypothetical protein
MFAEAVLGMERGGVTVAWNLCPIFRRREDIVKGLAGLKELRVKEARQVPVVVPTLGSIHQCLSLVQRNCHSRGCDETMCFAALTTTLPSSDAANYTVRSVD